MFPDQYSLKRTRTAPINISKSRKIKIRPKKLDGDDDFFRDACSVSDWLLASREKFKTTASNQTRPYGSARMTSSVWYFFSLESKLIEITWEKKSVSEHRATSHFLK